MRVGGLCAGRAGFLQCPDVAGERWRLESLSLASGFVVLLSSPRVGFNVGDSLLNMEIRGII